MAEEKAAEKTWVDTKAPTAYLVTVSPFTCKPVFYALVDKPARARTSCLYSRTSPVNRPKSWSGHTIFFPTMTEITATMYEKLKILKTTDSCSLGCEQARWPGRAVNRSTIRTSSTANKSATDMVHCLVQQLSTDELSGRDETNIKMIVNILSVTIRTLSCSVC